MSKRSRILSLLLAALMVSGLVFGVAAQDQSVLVLGFEQEPPNLWPLNTLVFGGLVENFYGLDLWEWDENRDPFPVMAESLPSIEDGTVITTEEGNTQVTVTLKEGLQWSDGEPITTADCEVWHRIRSDRSTSDSVSRDRYPDVVVGFEIVDERTFNITYQGNFPDFLAVNEQPECKYPGHIFGPLIENGGKLEDSDYFVGAQGSVGYGPYRMVEWNIGENVIYERNEFWQGEEPAFDRVVAQFITDDVQMRNAMQNGEIDVAFNWSDDQQPAYQAMDAVETFAAPGVFSDALWIRSGPIGNREGTGDFALQDPLVRQAIVHALDRQFFAEQLVGPGIEVPKSWYPPTLWPDDLPFLEFDVEQARALLAEAGWEDTNGNGTVDQDGVELDGLRFVTTENTLRNNFQLVIQEALREVGIGTEIQIIPATTLFASFADRGTLTNFEWDLAIFANSADPLTPSGDPDSYTCAGIPSAENPDGFNPWQFCDSRYDEVDALIGQTLPGPERDALIAEAVTRFFEGHFWHALRLRATWFAVDTTLLDLESVRNGVGTLAADWFNQIVEWKQAG